MVFSRLSFRWKAIIGIALIEALTLSVTIAGGLRHMERVQSDLIERSARAALTLYSAAVSDALISRDIAKVEAVSQDLISRTEAVFVRVLDQDGRVVTALGEPSALSRPFAADDNPLSDEHDAYAVSAPLLAGSDRIGEVQLSIDNRRARSELSTARKLAAVVAVSGMALAALFSWLLGGWLAAGVQRLSEGARRIASGGLDARVDEQGEKELRSLARTFNDMASALQARDAERSALLARAERAVDEAREASRAKSAFLAAMSHEIRTPLNGVVGLARIIADNRQPELAGDFSRQLGIASEQLRMIVNDILDFSKIEAGRLELEHIAFAVEDLATTCHALFGAQAKEKALELRVDIGRDVPYALWATRRVSPRYSATTCPTQSSSRRPGMSRSPST
jgi:methyl-accepting chemotaxis protein